MKLVFAHDHKLKNNNGNFYTTGGFSDEITKRYTDIFGNIFLICRGEKTNNVEKSVKINNKLVHICPMYINMLLPNRYTKNIIKKELHDATHVIVRMPSISGIYVAYYARKKGIPICVEVVGSAFGSYWFNSKLGKIFAIPLEIINKKIIKNADYVLYVSEQYLQNEYPTNGKTVSCSDVILDNRNSDVLENRIKKIKNMTDDKRIVIGTLGQINFKYKGHITVFKVIKELKKEGYSIEYRLAGTGSKERLERLAIKYNILDCVTFCGLIKHDDINAWIDNLDIYIQPSLTEGMPRSVIESIYRACPTIVSSAGGMFELVENNYTFRKGNTKELKKIIKNINKETLIQMSKRNFEFSKKFENDKLCKKRNVFYTKFKEER